MTARIYQFPKARSDNRAAKLLRDFSRQTGEVNADLGCVQDSLSKASSKLVDTGATLAGASDTMRETVEKFDERRALHQECLDAMDSGSLKAMRELARRLEEDR